MQKKQKILIGVAGGLVVIGVAGALAGPGLYRDFIAAPAAEAPSLEIDEGESLEPAAPLAAADLIGDWAIVSGSEAGYRVDEVLNGTDVTVTGRTDRVEGAIAIGEGLTLESAEFTVDVASIETDNGSRDEYFRARAMRVSEHPTATFRTTEAIPLGEAPGSGETVEQEVTGELTLAGVTQPVSVTVEVRSDGARTELAGAIPIVFADYGVDAPSLGFVSVEPTGQVEFQLIAERG
ncbi:YceI family protein [Leucobacter sp. CSA1]|uniref:YceI family protein n=1 Tax=Leucobacter chromiisoli TaxID=2796471 RepID=A0A934Q9S6_9MICO|nr:YceI family protein [Leucobacter chromiisoli]MBK0419890.1 YceI family protein [Leucobacter chromiisoli]